VDSGDVQVRVLDGAGGENHGVVESTEIMEGQIPAVGHVAQKANVATVQNLVQSIDDALDPGVVGGNSIADQSVRRGVRLEEIDADLNVAVLDLVGLGQDVRGVDSGWASPHNCNA